MQIVPGYIVAAEQSEFYKGCTKNSLIGLTMIIISEYGVQPAIELVTAGV